MIVAFDIDGVLANFTKSFVEVVNELWPGRAPKTFLPSDWWYSTILTQDEVKQALALFKTIRNRWMDLEELSGAAELRSYLPTFRKDNIDIYYCTARMPCAGMSMVTQTRFWLKEAGLFPYNTSLIIMGDDKHRPKAQVYDAIGVDWSIDDRDKTVEGSAALPNHTACLLDQPWNQDSKVGVRVKSVTEFCELVLAASRFYPNA